MILYGSQMVIDAESGLFLSLLRASCVVSSLNSEHHIVDESLEPALPLLSGVQRNKSSMHLTPRQEVA